MLATPTGGVGGAKPASAIDPIMDYPHGGFNCSDPGPAFSGIAITGGYVYRGPVASLQGTYFFADFGTARLWSLRYDGSAPATFDGHNYTELTDHTGEPEFTPDEGTIDSVSSFGQDNAGNLYVVDLDGDIFFIPEPGAVAMQLSGVALTLALAGWRRRRAGGRCA